jgi:hypothetical protein
MFWHQYIGEEVETQTTHPDGYTSKRIRMNKSRAHLVIPPWSEMPFPMSFEADPPPQWLEALESFEKSMRDLNESILNRLMLPKELFP